MMVILFLGRSISDYTDDRESSIYDFASGIEINDIDDDADVDTQYLEFETDWT